jgi:glucose-1-phosphate thymidylyltransferase
VDPVYVEDNVTLENSTIGPNVSVSAGSTIRGSTIRDSVVGGKTEIEGSALDHSLIGDNAVLSGVRGSVTIGDYSEVRVSATPKT